MTAADKLLYNLEQLATTALGTYTVNSLSEGLLFRMSTCVHTLAMMPCGCSSWWTLIHSTNHAVRQSHVNVEGYSIAYLEQIMYEPKVQQYSASVMAMYSKYTPEYNSQIGLYIYIYSYTFEHVCACVGGSAKGVGIWLGGMGVGGDGLGMSVHCTSTLP